MISLFFSFFFCFIRILNDTAPFISAQKFRFYGTKKQTLVVKYRDKIEKNRGFYTSVFYLYLEKFVLEIKPFQPR